MPHPFSFPPHLSLAQTPTPFHPLDELSDHMGGPRIWVKRDDLTGCVLSGNKVRKLEFVLARALEAGCDTLVTCGGLQSNHCRTTALLGAQLGFKVGLVLRGQWPSTPEGNLLLSQLAGADIHCYSPSDYRANLDTLLEHRAEAYRREGRNPWIIPTGASDGLGLWGYIAASRELWGDYSRAQVTPDCLICAAGSGGTLAGLTVGHHLYDTGTRVLGVAVCDNAAYFRRRVQEDVASIADAERLPDLSALRLPEVLDTYVGAGYGLADEPVFETIRKLAVMEGLVLDPVYTGKAFHGMLQELAEGHFDGCRDILFVHTGGIFGLFPYRQSLFG